MEKSFSWSLLRQDVSFKSCQSGSEKEKGKGEEVKKRRIESGGERSPLVR